MPSRIFRDGLLDGQVALVTGGGTGIGSAVARELAHLGAQVVIASRKASHVEPAAAHLSREVGREVQGIVCDIRDCASVGALTDEVVRRHGRLDVLVNNGGGQFLAPAETITARGWDSVVSTNLTGTWNVTRAVAQAWMLRHGGRVVNVTMLTTRGFPGMAHSVAARGGVEAMTRTLAVEWAQHGIKLNCIQPGVIASGGLLNYPGGQEIARQIQGEIPAKRLGTCEEVAWMVAWLVGPAGDYVTGQVLTIDGGRTLWGNTWPPLQGGELPPVDIPLEPWQTGKKT